MVPTFREGSTGVPSPPPLQFALCRPPTHSAMASGSGLVLSPPPFPFSFALENGTVVFELTLCAERALAAVNRGGSDSSEFGSTWQAAGTKLMICHLVLLRLMIVNRFSGTAQKLAVNDLTKLGGARRKTIDEGSRNDIGAAHNPACPQGRL